MKLDEREKRINILKKEIYKLTDKLLCKATDEIKPDVNAEGTDMAFIKRKQDMRSVRSALKEYLETYKYVQEVEELETGVNWDNTKEIVSDSIERQVLKYGKEIKQE